MFMRLPIKATNANSIPVDATFELVKLHQADAMNTINLDYHKLV